MIIDDTINVGNVVTGLSMLGAFLFWAARAGGDFRILKGEVKEISKKLDTFISKEIVAEQRKSADSVHGALQRQIDELRGRMGESGR